MSQMHASHTQPMPEESLAALDHVCALAARVQMTAAVLQHLSDDIVFAREEGLLDDQDGHVTVLYTMGRDAVRTARGLLAGVLEACSDEPALLGLSHHRAAIAQAQAKLSLAIVLIGDCDGDYEGDSPNADPFL